MGWITEHLPAWNGWIALLLYWLPLALCAYGFTVRSVLKFRNDRGRRDEQESEEHGFYMPTLTLGTLIGYAVTTVVPIANLFAAIFDVAPKVFADFWEWCDRALNIPLVPKRK
jgi:hypothetical protein